MGFRDIHAFNLAMLAKQAWRLIKGGHSLFVRVYRACYFPNCSFMEAELGCNPSFVWRSLLEARELIRAGTTWQVGDGQSIEVNDHRWLTTHLSLGLVLIQTWRWLTLLTSELGNGTDRYYNPHSYNQLWKIFYISNLVRSKTETSFDGRKLRMGTSRWRQLIGLHSPLIRHKTLNIPLQEKIRNSGIRCGSSLFPQRSETSCGEHALIYSQHPQTYAVGGYRWPLPALSASSMKKRWPMSMGMPTS